MYCSTCGAAITPGRMACSECGTRVPRALLRESPHPLGSGLSASAWKDPSVRHCPRCGYQGEGLSYFSRGAHVAALVGATVLTAGAMGAGGIVYYVVRREHQLCPRCGHGWGRYGERSLTSARHAYGVEGAGGARELRGPLAGSERGKNRVFALFALAALLAVVGISQFELVPILMALVAAGGGALLQRSARTEREQRRAALLASLQLPVLQLAARHGGRLTVTRVAAELGWTMPRAEKVLNALDDGVRVNSEVTDEGVIVYEFRELLGAPAPPPALPGEPD